MSDEYLKVYKDKSVYVSSGSEKEYLEGPQSDTASKNQEAIKKELENGYLDRVISNSFLTDKEQELIADSLKTALENLVASITSEVGRAIVGLTFLQLTIKSISPNQSIRLHKASSKNTGFSWVDGIPMRVLDNTYITPKLREHNLLKLNADGFMMTRSLAENYPYTALYKASIRGAKEEWVQIVNVVKNNPITALPALKYLVTLLKQRSDDFLALVTKAKETLNSFLRKTTNNEILKRKLFLFPQNSSYSARLFEILIHSFYCVLSDDGALQNYLKPLSQMRSANKKHGNIGDIELIERKNTMLIIESWDAKYGKPYLRDELEELRDKLESHPETRIAGFITETKPLLNKEITDRKSELEELFGIQIKIESIDEWYKHSLVEYKITDEDSFLRKWINTFFEYLSLNRTEIAPIDEPTNVWLEECLNQI